MIKKKVEDRKSISIYNQFIKACIESEEYKEAAKIILLMPNQNLFSSTSVYNFVLNSLISKGLLEEAKQIFISMEKHSIAKNKRTLALLSDLAKVYDLADLEEGLLSAVKNNIETEEEEKEEEMEEMKEVQEVKKVEKEGKNAKFKNNFFKDKTKDVASHHKKQNPLDIN